MQSSRSIAVRTPFRTTLPLKGALPHGPSLFQTRAPALSLVRLKMKQDCLRQPTQSNSVIDRIAPVVVSIPAPADDLLQSFNDENPGVPGMQKSVSVEVTGVEAGESVTVTISSETGEVFLTKEVLVVNSVPDSSSAQLSAGQFDFPDGTVVLTASTEDAAGNISNSVGRVLLVISELSTASLLTPGYLPPQSCTSNQECSSGSVCSGGNAIAWSSTTSKETLVETLWYPSREPKHPDLLQ